MKTLSKIFLAITLLIFTIGGCINYNSPHYDFIDACFTTSMNEYDINQSIYFSNCSSGADTYLWEFGDGTTSSSSNPTHQYQNAGTYTVKLTAYNKGGRSTASKIIYVAGTTKLDILVMYYGTSDPVSNCEVTLYGTLQNWIDLQNPLVKITTGSSGNVIFSDLEPVEYFVDAYRSVSDTSYYCNEKFEPSSGNLTANVVNYLDVFVELLYTTQKDGTLSKKYIIRKTELRQAKNSTGIRVEFSNRAKR
jgi:uncharacterized membrane protein